LNNKILIHCCISTQVFFFLFLFFYLFEARMLRWFPPFQVASTCFSCSPPVLNSVVTNCLLSHYVKWPLPPDDNPTAVNKYFYYYYYYLVGFFFINCTMMHGSINVKFLWFSWFYKHKHRLKKQPCKYVISVINTGV
jgi:hypothetical protein